MTKWCQYGYMTKLGQYFTRIYIYIGYWTLNNYYYYTVNLDYYIYLFGLLSIYLFLPCA